MSRPVRPRPVDIFKKLPIIRSSKDLEDEEITGTRASQSARLSLEIENESNSTAAKKNSNEIPTPQFVVVDSYERDYGRTFNQPSSYVRAKVRTENSDYVEYDLDDEDEDWLQDFDKEKTHLTPELFEIMLYKLEIMDHKARERAMGSVATLGPIVSVILQFDHAAELFQSYGCKPLVLQAVYNYWKEKREKWQKPILRRLQPPPPVNDANPYTVFRPREKTHRLHTRRMQRRENSVQSFEKLRQVRRNLEQAKGVIKALVKREERKKELLECEVELQRIHVKLKHETQHEDDVFTLPGLSLPHKFVVTKRGEEDRSALEIVNAHARRPGPAQISPVTDSMTILDKSDPVKRDARRTLSLRKGQIRKRDVDEPTLWFAKPLDPEKLALAGIIPPADPISPNDNTGTPLYRCRARMGRGGRVVFDRWDPLERIPLGISWSARNVTTQEAIN